MAGRRRRRALAIAILGALALASAVGSGLRQPAGGVLGTSSRSGGVVLDGWGGVHAFGGVSVNTSGAIYWPGWDIARSVAVLPGGSGGYTLDGFGGVHPFGDAPAAVGTMYWPGWDIARAISILPDGSGGYTLDGFGGLHNWGNAPPLAGQSWGWDIARGLDIHYNGGGIPDGGWIQDGWGGIHPFGGAYPLSSAHYYPDFPIFQSLHIVYGGMYQIARWGLIEQSGAPAGIDYSGMPTWGTWDIARDVFPINASLGTVAAPIDRASAGAAMVLLHSVDRARRGAGPLTADPTLTAIAGDGSTYNLAACGGPAALIGDRSADMYSRNYFAHPIAGCSGTQYVFSTYMRAFNIGYHQAGENIAWRSGDASLLDDIWNINNMWLLSPAHISNIMGPYSLAGCGVFDSPNGSYQGAYGHVWIWTCEFIG